MILIINTTADEKITAEIRQYDEGRLSAKLAKNPEKIEIIEAANLKISNCIGCNYCWLKTPGECAVKDDYEEILKKLTHTDKLVVISDTALGFINHKGKNVFDRIIPLITMNLHFKDKEMRHTKRYRQTTDIGLIYRGEADKDFMSRWVKRAAINIGGKSLGAYKETEMKEALACIF